MKRKRWSRVILWVLLIMMVMGGAGVTVAMNLAEKKLPGEETEIQTETKESETEKKEYSVPKPEVSEQLLTVNDYSRPGEKTDPIKYVVIHYLGNPKTTAQENHDYFESLKDLQNCYMSANYIVGLEGEIIQCVPDNEVAYASNQENHESISIENCHLDSTGKFLKDTYISLVKLTAYLTETYHLDRDQIIRHHDVTGKDCPIYYTEHEDYWEDFRDDVMTYRELCKKQEVTDEELEKLLKGIAHTYKDRIEAEEEESEEEETEEVRNGRDEYYEEDFVSKLNQTETVYTDDVPDTSYMPDTTYTPETSDTAVEPEAPETPETPDTTYTPDTSATPDTVVTPDTSATPDTAVEPETPDTAVEPEAPETPETPDTTYTPDTSVTPDTSGTADIPASGEESGNEAQPDTSDNAGENNTTADDSAGGEEIAADVIEDVDVETAE